jgi:hypothetical protein
MAVNYRDANQFRDLIVGEYEKYGRVVREAGIQAQ